MSSTELLLVNGRVYGQSADATAVAISADGIIGWVGQDAPARALYPDARVIDLDGAFVAPAFVDAHVHATSSGLMLTGVDLRTVGSAAELVAALRKYAAEHPGEPIYGHGWDESTWTDPTLPTRADIDAAVGSTPTYLSRIDVHSALASTALTAEPGVLTVDAHHRARVAFRELLPVATRQRAQLAFLEDAATKGIASVHECGGPDISGRDDFTDLIALGQRVDLPEVLGYWGETGSADLAKELGATGLAGDLSVDGAIGSHTACFHEPYADLDTTGNAYLDADQIAAHLVTCTEAGIQAGFHVIGDAAASALVAGIVKAASVVGKPRLASAGHRVEHLALVTAAEIAVLAEHGFTASMQPAFDAAWGGPDGMYATRLGLARAERMNALAALAATGVVLAFGSDAPVTPVDPWSAIRAAVHPHYPEHGISPRAAFTAHTRGARRAGGQLGDGILRPGAGAHLAIWAAGDLEATTPSSTVQRWSTDPRSGVPGLPSVEPGVALPECLATLRAGIPIFDKKNLFT
jgi:predicted amidohydrolase YtcJ